MSFNNSFLRFVGPRTIISLLSELGIKKIAGIADIREYGVISDTAFDFSKEKKWLHFKSAQQLKSFLTCTY